MRPYTTTGNNNTTDELRTHWRENKNYHRKVTDRSCKKSHRTAAKRKVRNLAASIL